MAWNTHRLSWQVSGKVVHHSMGPFSEVCTPEITPGAFSVVIWYMVSLLRLPPYGRKGNIPVATWYSVTPWIAKSSMVKSFTIYSLLYLTATG